MNNKNSSLLSSFIEKLQRIKKSDWLAIGLAGAILLILALPETGGNDFVLESGNTFSNGSQTEMQAVAASGQNIKTSASDSQAEEYVAALEKKLEDVLAQMDGVGEVKVMITISDYGECIVEKDVAERSNTVTESENGNIGKTSVDQEINEQTVHVEDENGTYPYVEKELLPTVEGIVVVAEGGGNGTVVSNISKAVMALFPVEAHKIIVVKMSDKGAR